MCLILDVNIVHRVFPQPSQDFIPIFDSLSKKRARIAYGGHLKTEYRALHKFWRILVELDRGGSARPVDDNRVQQETDRLRREDGCCSDDHHIIALALVSGVRLLCSEDRELHADFKNRSLLNPPGSIYQDASHAHLVRQHCSMLND